MRLQTLTNSKKTKKANPEILILLDPETLTPEEWEEMQLIDEIRKKLNGKEDV